MSETGSEKRSIKLGAALAMRSRTAELEQSLKRAEYELNRIINQLSKEELAEFARLTTNPESDAK